MATTSNKLRTVAALCMALLAPTWLQPQALAQAAAPDGAVVLPPARVIVKYRADSNLLRQQALSAAEAHAGRAQALGQRLGMALRGGMGLAEGTQVVFAGGMTSQALAERLARESDVEFAVPDLRKHTLAVPNDANYLTVSGAGGPAAGQWYLRPPQAAAATTSGTIVSSINAEAAWDVTLGSSGVVVAVLDTGIRFDHPDLKKVADGGNLLDGYDMLADDTGPFTGTFASAGDGDGRDGDPSDTGTWITSADAADSAGVFYQCPVSNSSWHGTQMAGLLGAITDNSLGMASVGRNVRVLPVRVLGRCGGYDSDIIAGMRWAAGIGVPGVPANPNPAKVINLSLGSSGVCSAAYQAAVNEIVARGVVIVASAGNSGGGAVGTPANCVGVIAVGGLRNVGSKVGFSDLGSEIAIGAPAGNCINATGACLFPILTTVNTGTQGPVSNAAGGSSYTDGLNRPSFGTSYSAPLVAGTAALMLSVQPSLTPASLRALLQATARPFPNTGAGSGIARCTAPQFDSAGRPIEQVECYCTKTTCGAGMLDTAGAVLAAAGEQARIAVSPAAVTPGTAVSLTASPTTTLAGRSAVAYRWTIADDGGIVSSFTGATDGTTAFVTPSAAGTFTVALTVTDSAGVPVSTTASIEVRAAVAEAGSSGEGNGGGALGAGWLLALLGAVAATRCAARSARSPT